ncbi:MAG: peptide ABC transporter substrate-binding protein, partial [Bacillota bacterium]|nr:peptide ABC transporter substrate-binding protein [Bacillota bacterium]
ILITALVFTGCSGNDTNEPIENDPSEEGDAENSDEDVDNQEEAEEEIAQEIVFIIGDEPTSLDPGLVSDSTPSTVLSNTFEGLTTLDLDDNPMPAMAEDWEISEDKLTYTFNLRDDILWSDGEEVTAYDFEYAWKRVIDPETAAGFGYFLLEHIQNAQKYYNGEVPIEEVGIKVIDDKTIEVKLENPTPYFLNLTATWTMFPVREDAVNSGENWFKNPDTFIVNGPFMAEEYNQGEYISLVPNPNYYNAEKVKLERIRFDFLEDPSNALAAFESGAVDGSEIVPSADIPRLKMELDGFYLLPYVQHIWINFNTQVAPYDDVNVRKALTYAIDREALVTQVLQGGQVPATGLVPYGIVVDGKDFREEGGDYGIPASGDVEKAKEFFAMAGYENGEGFPELVIKDNGKSYIEVVKEMWETNLGIEVTIEEKEFGVYLQEVKAGDYTVSRGGWTGDYGYPTDYLSMYTENSGVNFSHWYNEEYMEKLEMAKTSDEESERVELMHEAESIFMEAMPIAPLYYATSPMLVNPNLKGWHQSQLGYLFFRDAQIVK